eukprot:1151205-Pelagomonas_calceolata.AAC.7
MFGGGMRDTHLLPPRHTLCRKKRNRGVALCERLGANVRVGAKDCLGLSGELGWNGVQGRLRDAPCEVGQVRWYSKSEGGRFQA